MPVKNQTYFRGFLVPSPFSKTSFESTTTTATQASPRCGDPKSTTTNDLILSAFGSQDDFDDITIETIKGGTPGNVNNPAMFKFYQTGESTEYGQLGRTAISGFEMIAAETTEQYNYPYILPLSNGDKLVAYQRYTTGNNKFVLVDKCLNSDTTSTWTNKKTIEVLGSSGGTGFDVYPSMVEMDDGSILLAFYTLNVYWNVTIYRSTDNGDTWTLANENALPVGLETTNQIQQRIRMAYSKGQLVLLCEFYFGFATETHRNRIQQYISINGGMTFSLVDESIAGDGYFYRIDLYTDTLGDFIFTWIRDPDYISILKFSDASSSIVDQVSGSQYHDIIDYSGGGSSALSTSSVTSNLLSNGECTSYELPNGERHLIHRVRSLVGASTYNTTNLTYSVDGEINNFVGSFIILDFDDTQTRLLDTHARYIDGRVGLFSSHLATPGPDDNSVHVLWINTISTVSLEVTTVFPLQTGNQFDVLSFTKNWLPFDEPQATGNWTRSTGGSNTDTISDGKMEIVSNTATSYIYYTDANMDATSTMRFRCEPLVGGSTASLTRGVELQYDDGANRYVVEIRIDTNAISVYDVNGATEVGNSSGHTSQQIDFLVSFTGPYLLVWINYDVYRSRKNWTKIVDASITSAASTGAINQIKFGHVGAVGTLTRTNWYEFHVGVSASSFATIQPLIGLPYPSTGFCQFVNGGCSISTIDGPARIGDTYQITKQYDYPLERVVFDVNTSPRIKWRSTSTAAQDIVFFTYGDDTVRDVATNNMGAITLLGCNFQSFTLYYEAFGSWTSLGTIDMSDGLVCDLIRIGSTVRSTTSSGGSFYAFENEFAGCFCLLNSGATNKYRKILSNSSGVMGSATGKPATFVLDGIDDTEPTSGTFKVFSNRMTVVHSVLSASRFKIEFASQDTVDGFFEIGQIIHGSMFIFAPQYGRGRSITYEANTDVYQTVDNQIKTRTRSIGNRSAKISWTDPVDQSSLFDATYSGEFFNTLNADSQTYAIANFGDIPYSMMGLYTYLDGAGKPVVYLPAINNGSTIQKFNRYNDFIYGITTSSISIDNVLGDENETEVFRVSQIDLREIT